MKGKKGEGFGRVPSIVDSGSPNTESDQVSLPLTDFRSPFIRVSYFFRSITAMAPLALENGDDDVILACVDHEKNDNANHNHDEDDVTISNPKFHIIKDSPILSTLSTSSDCLMTTDLGLGVTKLHPHSIRKLLSWCILPICKGLADKKRL
ncbi:hypothetical protein L1887_32676 [Cichorium endivia]|nr:hypothetical protein L1887_32676 [Cichorium endivia]